MTTALCIDMEDLLDTYFRVKYKAEVEFDGEYLHSGRDYSEVVIPHYEITSDPDGLVSSLHEIVLGSSEGD